MFKEVPVPLNILNYNVDFEKCKEKKCRKTVVPNLVALWKYLPARSFGPCFARNRTGSLEMFSHKFMHLSSIIENHVFSKWTTNPPLSASIQLLNNLHCVQKCVVLVILHIEDVYSSSLLQSRSKWQTLSTSVRCIKHSYCMTLLTPW